MFAPCPPCCLLLVALLWVTTAAPGSPECKPQDLPNMVIDASVAVAKGARFNDPINAASAEECVSACCSEHSHAGDRSCNLAVYDTRKSNSVPNCYLFLCPGPEACPMTPTRGVRSYSLWPESSSEENGDSNPAEEHLAKAQKPKDNSKTVSSSSKKHISAKPPVVSTVLVSEEESDQQDSDEKKPHSRSDEAEPPEKEAMDTPGHITSKLLHLAENIDRRLEKIQAKPEEEEPLENLPIIPTTEMAEATATRSRHKEPKKLPAKELEENIQEKRVSKVTEEKLETLEVHFPTPEATTPFRTSHKVTTAAPHPNFHTNPDLISSSTPKAKAANRVASSDKDSAGRVASSDKDSAGRVPSSDKDIAGRVPSSDKDSAGRVPSSDKDSAGRVPSSDKDSAGRVPSSDKDSAGRVPSSDKDSADKVASSDKYSADKVASSDKDSGKRVASSDKDNADRLASSDKYSADRVASSHEDGAGKVASSHEDSAGKVASSHEDSAGKVASSHEDSAGKVASSHEDSAGKVASSHEDNANNVASAHEDSAGKVASSHEDNANKVASSHEDSAGQVASLHEDNANKVASSKVKSAAKLPSADKVLGTTGTTMHTKLPQPETPGSPSRTSEGAHSFTSQGTKQLDSPVAASGNPPKNLDVQGPVWGDIDKSGLVAALVFGVLFLVVVIGLVSRKVSEARRRHQYTKLDYLINGMYVDT